MKAWLMWKALGDDGMAAAVDRAYDNARFVVVVVVFSVIIEL
jgi:hypothetical protein